MLPNLETLTMLGYPNLMYDPNAFKYVPMYGFWSWLCDFKVREAEKANGTEST